MKMKVWTMYLDGIYKEKIELKKKLSYDPGPTRNPSNARPDHKCDPSRERVRRAGPQPGPASGRYSIPRRGPAQPCPFPPPTRRRAGRDPSAIRPACVKDAFIQYTLSLYSLLLSKQKITLYICG